MPEYKGYTMSKNKFPFWDKLIIDAGYVTHKRYKMIGVDERSIPISAINTVIIKNGILFSDVIVNIVSDSVVAEGVIKKDTIEIRSLLGF